MPKIEHPIQKHPNIIRKLIEGRVSNLIKKLDIYIETVYNEIYKNMNWDYVTEEYWIPVFEYHQSLNKK